MSADHLVTDPVVRMVMLTFGDLRTAEELAKEIAEGARQIGWLATLSADTQGERLRNVRLLREAIERAAHQAARMERAIESGVPE